MILALLLAVTATIHPAKPAVGDLIRVDFPQPVVIDASPDFELVSQQGSRVVVRTFQPKPFSLRGRMGGTPFDIAIPVAPTLAPNDALKPAPLKPPAVEPYPPLPFVLIGIAFALAAVIWTIVVLTARRVAATEPLVQRSPPEQFRATVLALRNDPRAPRRWARLADATRIFLAATDPTLGAELTTSELLGRTAVPEIAEILRQGDLEKFSPWGPLPGDFEALADRALALVPEEKAEAAA